MIHIAKETKILYTPIVIVQLYLTGIVTLYILGPLEWRTENPLLFYSYLIIAQVLLMFGYIRGMEKEYSRQQSSDQKVQYIITKANILIYLKYSITISCIVLIMYLMRNTGLRSFSVIDILTNFFKGFSDSGGQYLDKFNQEIYFGGNWLAPLITLSSPFLWPVIPLSIIFFKELSLYNKIITGFSIFFEAARWISTGTNKGVIDLILTIIFIVIIKIWQKKFDESHDDSHIENNDQAPKIKRNVGILILVLVMLGALLFVNNIDSRVKGDYELISQITGDTKVNLESPLMILVPDALDPLMVYTSQYLTQGYYGLSLSLGEKFVPMFGVGNSIILLENFQDLLKINLYQFTYQERISYKGWDPKVNWHSVHVWLANDLSFPGTLVLMFFLGKYFALITFRSIFNKDPIASILMIMLLLVFFYFPMNNQILSSPLTFMAFWGINAFWIVRVLVKIKSCG